MPRHRSTKFYPLWGGLDLVSPALLVESGRCRSCVNYESSPRGYQRIDGWERFSGKQKPSTASYWYIGFDAGTDAISEGDTVTGGTSSATGVALIDAVISSGSYSNNDAVGYNILTNVSGTFQNNEALEVSAASKSTSDGAAIQRGASTDALDTTYYRDAIETARTAIVTVTGSGDMRGVWVYDGVTYAFRDNGGASAVVMFKSTSSGWSVVDLGERITFTSGGTTEIIVGNTVVGASSAATAVVRNVRLTSGTWGAGTAAGEFILYTQTGTFQSENLNVSGGGSNLATIAGNSSENTFAVPGGRFEFVNYNFTGHAGSGKMYGCDGKNKAFEFDGSYYIPITTGMTTDAPEHVFAHKKHLFLSFTGGSVQHSGIGSPYTWSVITGAAEIGIGEPVTGFGTTPSKILAIYGQNTINLLYGTSVSDWELVELTDEAGAIEHTVQSIGTPIYLDDQGIRNLDTTDRFGDFALGTLTSKIAPVFASKRAASVTAVASVRSRKKDQYRLFFSDGTGISLYFGRELPDGTVGRPEPMLFDTGIVITCICSSEDSSGNEVIFFGSTNGYIYEMDSGTSKDGSDIVSFVRLPFANVGSPDLVKRWHKAIVDLEAGVSTSLLITADFDYGNSDAVPTIEESLSVNGGGGSWNQDDWNEFYWSSPLEGTAEARIPGRGRNVSMVIASEATYDQVHTLHGIRLQYSDRKFSR